jgi:hypothetical protein
MAKKKLPPDVLDYFRKEGSRGGKKAAASLTPEQRTARAQKAALALSPKERSERARKAVAAREAKRKRHPNS